MDALLLVRFLMAAMESCPTYYPVDNKLPTPDGGHERDGAAGRNDIFINGNLAIDQN